MPIKPFRCNNAECQQILAYTDGQHLYHGVMLDERFVRRCRDIRAEVALECTCGTIRTWKRRKALTQPIESSERACYTMRVPV